MAAWAACCAWSNSPRELRRKRSRPSAIRLNSVATAAISSRPLHVGACLQITFAEPPDRRRDDAERAQQARHQPDRREQSEQQRDHDRREDEELDSARA